MNGTVGGIHITYAIEYGWAWVGRRSRTTTQDKINRGLVGWTMEFFGQFKSLI